MPYKNPVEAKIFYRKYYLKHREYYIKKAKQYYIDNRIKRDQQKNDWAIKNIEKLRIYRRKYYAEYYKIPKNIDKRFSSVEKWKSINKNKALCHQIVRNAIERGDLIKPKRCSECGSFRKIHAHHPDYKKPLAVKWLCPICHGKEHKKELK